MEKRTPHCRLGVVKAMVVAAKVRATVSALASGAALGFGFGRSSASSHADHRVWQDVYRPKTPAGEVYLKLTVIDDVLIVSFKES